MIKTSDLTQEKLKKLIRYDSDTGEFFRLKKRGEKIIPCCLKHRDYFMIRFRSRNRSYAATRLAWLYMTGSWPSEFVSFRDGNPSNLKWDNLYELTSIEMARKRQPVNKKNGLPRWVVSEKGGKFYAGRITIAGKSYFLGYHKTPMQAHFAVKRFVESVSVTKTS